MVKNVLIAEIGSPGCARYSVGVWTQSVSYAQSYAEVSVAPSSETRDRLNLSRNDMRSVKWNCLLVSTGKGGKWGQLHDVMSLC